MKCPKCKSSWLYGPYDTTNQAIREEAVEQGIQFPINGKLLCCTNNHYFIISFHLFKEKEHLVNRDHYLFGRT